MQPVGDWCTGRAKNSAQPCHDWPMSPHCASVLLFARARASCGCIHLSVISKIISLTSPRSELPRDFSDGIMRAILSFHSIDDTGSILHIAEDLRRLLLALQRSGIRLLDLDTLLRPQTKTGVTLTFDYGMRSVFTEALPILRSYSAPAHLFLTTGVVGRTNRWPSRPATAPFFEMLRWREIEALQLREYTSRRIRRATSISGSSRTMPCGRSVIARTRPSHRHWACGRAISPILTASMTQGCGRSRANGT